MTWATKREARKSDGLSTHRESLKLGLTEGFKTAMSKANQELNRVMARRIERYGADAYGREEGRLCACGEIAIRHWKNVFWCKGCYDKRGCA